MSNLTSKNEDDLILMEIFNRKIQEQLQLSLKLILAHRQKLKDKKNYVSNKVKLLLLFESNEPSASDFLNYMQTQMTKAVRKFNSYLTIICFEL